MAKGKYKRKREARIEREQALEEERTNTDASKPGAGSSSDALQQEASPVQEPGATPQPGAPQVGSPNQSQGAPGAGTPEESVSPTDVPQGGNAPAGDTAKAPGGERPEDISPSLKGGARPVDLGAQKAKSQGLQDRAKKGLAEGAEKAAEEPMKQGMRQAARQAIKAAGQAIARAAMSALSAIAGYLGGPAIAVIVVVCLIILLIFGGIACLSWNGYYGQTLKQTAGKDDPHVLALIEAAKQEIKPGFVFGGGTGKTYHKLDFANQRDLEYLQSGEIDKRLAAALDYLVQRHEHIRVSHIVSAYEDMQTNPESGAFHDNQITRNISAHKDGRAADIDEIDFLKEQCDCGRDIPVSIAWQVMNENPFGEAPDALNKIKSVDDFNNPEVKKALEKLGVKGLDQQDLIDKMKAVPVLAGITSPYDLTKPEVIEAFNTIGVNGLDNEDLQKGLKRVQALQALYELAPSDITALQDPQVQKLMQEAGVPVNSELLNNISKYQAVQVLQSISSPDDLNRPEVQEALRTLNVDTTDANFQSMLSKVTAASTITNWQGDYTDQKFKDALGQFGIAMGSDAEQALKIYQTASKLFTATNNGMVNDAEIIRNLEQLAIDIGNPAAQDAVNKIKAAYKIYQLDGNYSDPELAVALQQMGITLGSDAQDALTKYQAAYKAINFQGDYSDPAFLSYIQTLGIPVNDDTKQALGMYKAATDILNFQGDYTSPEFTAALSKVGINLGDNQEIIGKYKAAQVLADAASGKIPYDSQEVKDALKTIGASSINDAKAKAAINIGNSQDPNDPNLQKDKEILGMNKAEQQAALAKLMAAKNLMTVNDFSDLQDPKVQASLRTLGLEDPKYYDAINKMGSAYALLQVKEISDLQSEQNQKALQNLGLKDPKYYDAIGKLAAAEKLLQIRDISDLQNPEVQKSLRQIGINDPKVYTALGKIGSLQTLLQVNGIQDLANPKVQDALKNLGVKNQAVYDNLAKVGSVYALTQIQSPWDLTKPEVIKALGDLKIADAALQAQLAEAGSLYALTQIKSPADLLKPESLKALDTLGVIELNDQLLGQIGAVQTLLQVDSVTDLLNPNSILALNTLGLISLSNPITTALMVVSFIDNLLGGALLGGLFGDDCDASTKCYKPTAQKNVHTAIEQLLQFPFDTGSPDQYRITQLITYSEERDVQPFSSKLDQLYGTGRPANLGLFAMPEAWQNIHIGY